MHVSTPGLASCLKVKKVWYGTAGRRSWKECTYSSKGKFEVHGDPVLLVSALGQDLWVATLAARHLPPPHECPPNDVKKSSTVPLLGNSVCGSACIVEHNCSTVQKVASGRYDSGACVLLFG